MNPPVATILIPTHNHFLTLPLSVKSALQQTIKNIEVIIIGDGVSPETRKIAQSLQAGDPRVKFLDSPKELSHGEVYRDLAIKNAQSNAIFYLCDDDLLMPRHVENLLKALEDAAFAHSLSCYFDAKGDLFIYPTDISKPEAIQWHLLEPRRNSVSITGACHRKDYYLSLPEGWTTTPANEWPDHYMWKKFFRRPNITAKTVMEITAIQFPSSLEDRASWSQEQRLAEIKYWFEKLPDAQTMAELNRLTTLAALRQLDENYRHLNLVSEYNEQLLTISNLKLDTLNKEHTSALNIISEYEEQLKALNPMCQTLLRPPR